MIRVKQYNRFLKLILSKYVIAITLWPFGIYYREEMSVDTYQHELIHWRQQKEMIGVFFYLWYVLEWFVKLFFFGRYAYYHISFEEEAFNWEKETRHYGWIKYILK